MEDRRTEDEDFLMGISRKFLSAAGTGLLAAALAEEGGVRPRTVVKEEGATWIRGLRLVGTFDDED